MRTTLTAQNTKQPHFTQKNDSPSRKFVLETKNSWCPNAAPIRSPNRGTRTADMPQLVPSIVHSENINKFTQKWNGKVINGTSTIQLSQHTDLTLTQIESGFMPQKMCSRLQSLGVLVLEDEHHSQHLSKTLQQKLSKTSVPRQLPVTNFCPKTSDFLNFLPVSFNSLQGERTPFLTESIARSSAAASIVNCRLADALPVGNVPGAEINSLKDAVKKGKQAEFKFTDSVRVVKNRDDNAIFRRLGEFEDRNNTADRICAEIISQLCVQSDKVEQKVIDRIKKIVGRAFREDFEVTEHQISVQLQLDQGITPDIEGIGFDSNVQDENIRVCVKLIQNGLVQKLKQHLIILNVPNNSSLYKELIQLLVTLCQLGPSIRDAFYHFSHSLSIQSLPLIFTSRYISLSREFVLSLAILSRINYATAPQLLTLAIEKINQILSFKEENDEKSSESEECGDNSLAGLIKNSMAKQTQFQMENDQLTLNIQNKINDDKKPKQQVIVFNQDMVIFLLFLCQNCVFGVLQNIMIFQQQVKQKKAISKSETEKGQNMVAELQGQLSQLFSVMGSVKNVNIELQQEEMILIQKLNSLSDNGIYLCEELVQIGMEQESYVQKLNDVMKNLFSE